MKKTIWGNCVVKNEGRYIWFALLSVISYLDKVLIYDTGSTDDTIRIIKILLDKYPSKIIFKQIGEVDAKGLTKARQKMLEETKSDWLILVDGDEVWWEESIKSIVNRIRNTEHNLYALVQPVVNLIGDIYHFQDDLTGEYNILGKKGHLNIRAINRNIKGLHIKNEYPLEGFFTEDKRLIQSFGEEKLEFIDSPILHFSNLKRSNKIDGDRKSVRRTNKLKYEIGKKFDSSFKYPEVFYQTYPNFIISPWKKMSAAYKLRAIVETPLKKIKRMLVK